MAARFIFQEFSGFISHNVPAVCDVLPARIRALCSKDQGWQNVAEKNRTKGVARLRFFGARAAYWRRSIYRPVMRWFFCFICYMLILLLIFPKIILITISMFL
jgi:hypothetical protein